MKSKTNTQKTPERYLMTAENILIDDDLFFEDDHINAYIAAWFDVDLRFNLQTRDTPDYINVYADYYPDEDYLTVIYIIIHNDGRNDEDFEVQDLADSEREVIIRLMNEKCKEENDGLNIAAALKQFNEEDC